MLLDRKVTEGVCSCGKGYKHYSRGNSLNKNVTSEKKMTSFRERKKIKYTVMVFNVLKKKEKLSFYTKTC